MGFYLYIEFPCGIDKLIICMSVTTTATSCVGGENTQCRHYIEVLLC